MYPLRTFGKKKCQLYKSTLGDLKHRKDFKRGFYFNDNDNLLYRWLKLRHAIPRKWKHILKQNLDISQNLNYLNHHLIKNKRLVRLVFSRFLDLRANLGNVKEKPFLFEYLHPCSYRLTFEI